MELMIQLLDLQERGLSVPMFMAAKERVPMKRHYLILKKHYLRGYLSSRMAKERNIPYLIFLASLRKTVSTNLRLINQWKQIGALYKLKDL